MTKIVYAIGNLAIMGGTERIISEKANYFSEQLSYDVTIICCNYHPHQPAKFYISNNVRIIYLDQPVYAIHRYKYPKRLWKKIEYAKNLRKTLTDAVLDIDPDIVIGLGHFKGDLISTIKCRAKKVIECHDARPFILCYKGNHLPLYSKLFKFIYRILYFKTIERHADVVVTLTHGDMALWHKARRIEVIPNFSNMTIENYSTCSYKRIIAIGRLRREKGFIRLIDIWKSVASRYPDWKLDLYGDGEQANELKLKIKNEHVQRITIQGFCDNLSKEYSSSSILVSTSFFEGFSLVILEAMKHGVPCIAFDCPFGPRSIIEDNKNGFLVEDGNISLFADRVCKLIENESLRKKFGADAIERSKHFDIDSIMNQWRILFEELICND
jgi:glycosyltransferase involved in cell wall biosynthesis